MKNPFTHMTFTAYILQPTTVVLILVVAATIFLFWLVFDVRKKWKRYFGASITPDGEPLRVVVSRLIKSEEKTNVLEERISELERIAKISIQKVGFLRYNPFHDIGSDQSFSLALLDKEHDGVVVTSLHTREGTRVYAKGVKEGTAKQSLSDEEKKVLEQAVQVK